MTTTDATGRFRFKVSGLEGAAAVPVEPLPTPLAKQKFVLLATAVFVVSLAANAGGFFNTVLPEIAETARAVDDQAVQVFKVGVGATAAGAGLNAWPRIAELPRRSGRDFVLLGTAFFLVSLAANSAGLFDLTPLAAAEARQGYESAMRPLGVFLLSFAGPVALLAALAPGAPAAERSQGLSGDRSFVALTAAFFASCTASGSGFLDGLSGPDSDAVGAIGSLLGVFSTLFVLASLFRGVSAWYVGEVADRGLYNNKLVLGLSAFFAFSLVASPFLFP